MLVVDSLQISYQQQQWCWRFSLPVGAFCAITGESGVGKSSLLAALSGAMPVIGGEVYWQQQALTSLSMASRPFAFLFQQDNLFMHLTVQRNLALGLTHSWRVSAVQQQQIMAVAKRMGIEDLLMRKPGALSGGQYQRVALARVMLQQKPILLLDEPFSALDLKLRQQAIQWVSQLQREQGLTVLMVTHHFDEIRAYCSHQLQAHSAQDWQLVALANK